MATDRLFKIASSWSFIGQIATPRVVWIEMKPPLPWWRPHVSQDAQKSFEMFSRDNMAETKLI